MDASVGGIQTSSADPRPAPPPRSPGWVDLRFMPGNITPFPSWRKPANMAPTKGRSLDHIGFEVKILTPFAKKLQSLGLTF